MATRTKQPQTNKYRQRRMAAIWFYRTMPLVLLLCIFIIDLPDMTLLVALESRIPSLDESSDAQVKQASSRTLLATSTSSSSSSSSTPPYHQYKDHHQTAILRTTIMTNNSLHGVKARAFEKWNGAQIPCFPPTSTNKNHRKRGLLYLKLHKVGSSSAAGINARIARNEAQRRRLFQVNRTAASTSSTTSAATAPIHLQGSCAAQLAHAVGKKLCPHRNRKKSFLWSIVRDPTSRVVSRFFHSHVSYAKKEPNDEAAVRFFCPQGDHYMSRLSTVPMVTTTDAGKSSNEMSEEDRVQYANKIMSDYDFIGVTERMDESAVALSMLLDIPLSDVLYLDGKVTGGYGLEKCIYFVPSFQSPAMQDYFQTREFQDCTKWDRIIHQVANRSLDLTIDETLGRAEFEAKLAEFRAALAYANQYCDDSKVVFSCAAGGINNYKKENDCLYKDSGCGYKCLDEVSKKLNL